MLAALVDLPCWPPQGLRDEGGYPLASAGLSRGRPGGADVTGYPRPLSYTPPSWPVLGPSRSEVAGRHGRVVTLLFVKIV